MDVLYGGHPRAFWTNLHDNTLVSMSVPATHEQDTSRTRRETSPITVVVSLGKMSLSESFVCLYPYVFVFSNSHISYAPQHSVLEPLLHKYFPFFH